MDGVPAQLPRQETLEALIGELGIANDSHVVVVSAGTDALDISSAARVYWTFKVIGHDRVSILDCGYRAYAAAPATPMETGRFGRSAERRVGKECVRSCSSRGSPHH